MKVKTIYDTILPAPYLMCCGWVAVPCSCKTTIAALLAEKYGLQLYRFDRQEMAHIRRSSPEQRPALTTFLAMSMDERWLLRSPEAMAENVIASWTERFPFVLEDLNAMPPDPQLSPKGRACSLNLSTPIWQVRTMLCGWCRPMKCA